MENDGLMSVLIVIEWLLPNLIAFKLLDRLCFSVNRVANSTMV